MLYEFIIKEIFEMSYLRSDLEAYIYRSNDWVTSRHSLHPHRFILMPPVLADVAEATILYAFFTVLTVPLHFIRCDYYLCWASNFYYGRLIINDLIKNRSGFFKLFGEFK
jgi:hypothetical protein